MIPLLFFRWSPRYTPVPLVALAFGLVTLLSACEPWAQTKRRPMVDFVTLDGRPLGPSQYHGKPLLVNFWASTCSVCLKEMPLLESTYQRHASAGLQVVAVAMPYDMPSAAVELQQAKGWTFTVAIDPRSEAVNAFGGVSATPTTVLLDATGQERWRHVGELQADALNQAIQQVIPAAVR